VYLQVRSIPRADVAELCVQCLTLPEAACRSFDVIALKPEESANGGTTDFKALIASLKGGNCDYSINRQGNF